MNVSFSVIGCKNYLSDLYLWHKDKQRKIVGLWVKGCYWNYDRSLNIDICINFQYPVSVGACSFPFRISVHSQKMWSCAPWSWGQPQQHRSARKWWVISSAASAVMLLFPVTPLFALFHVYHQTSLFVCAPVPTYLTVLPHSLFVRPWWRKRLFTHLKWSPVSSCHGLSRVWLLPLLHRRLHTQDRRGSPCPSLLVLLRFLRLLWRNQPWCLAPPPLRMAWGDVRDGESAAQAEINGGSRRRGWEGGCHSRRSGKRHRCSPLCSVSRSAD